MSVYLTWKRGDDKMVAFHRTIDVSNKVYEILTQCPKDHVVLSTNADGSDGVPYKPQGFPAGMWNVRMPEERDPAKAPFVAPWIIPTDAHQMVEEWELDEHGLYKCPTGRMVTDWGYALHHIIIAYTFGCLGVLDIPDVLWLKDQIIETLKTDLVHILVTEA